MAQGSENHAPSKGLSGFLLPSFLLPFFQSGQRNFWVQLCWIFLFIKQDPHLYSWGVKPNWLNAAVSRGFVLAIKSEPKKTGMVVCAYNSRAEEAEEGSYSRLLSVFLANRRSIQGGGMDSA